jgi:mannose-6-phosphate isomerase-like protein (cupin superfamily)
MQIIDGAGRYARPAAGEQVSWAEHLRVPDLSVGTYSIPAGGADEQTPHTEDEIYVVMTGRATFEAAGQRADVGPGSVIYVPAGEQHRFTGISADLAVLVLFAPAEYSRADPAERPAD